MARQKQDEEDEITGPNNTLDGLLRKLNDGDAVNTFGHKAQGYFADLRRAAKRRGGAVKGKITITLDIRMGADGYGLTTPEMTTKPIPEPAMTESMVYFDEDGDVNGKPIPKQATIYEVKNGKGPAAKDAPAPETKAM